MIRHSATLAINERINARRAAGQQVLHLGFGEAGLPVLPEIAEVLRGATGRNAYGSVAGSLAARQAVAGYLSRRNVPTEPEQVLLAPGSKALLYAAMAALSGDIVLPVPSWVTYAAQAAMTGKRVIGVPVPAHVGGVPDPDRFAAALDAARADGADPRILLVTLPDNPTGTAADPENVRGMCALAEEHDLTIVSDEIYRDLTFPGVAHASPAETLPERTIVTGGLSKHLALGGWRIGFARVPDAELTERFVGIASELWSSLAAPMQVAAEYAFGEPDEVRARVAASARLHEAVLRAVQGEFVAAGARCREPQAAFYCYPDLGPLSEPLAARGIHGGEALADTLLDEHGVGVLAGAHFGDDPAALCFRVATSLLYGDTDEEREESLRSEHPERLPRVTAALDHLRTALKAVTS